MKKFISDLTLYVIKPIHSEIYFLDINIDSHSEKPIVTTKIAPSGSADSRLCTTEMKLKTQSTRLFDALRPQKAVERQIKNSNRKIIFTPMTMMQLSDKSRIGILTDNQTKVFCCVVRLRRSAQSIWGNVYNCCKVSRPNHFNQNVVVQKSSMLLILYFKKCKQMKNKRALRISTWNIRSMLRKEKNRIEIAKVVEKYNLKIAQLQWLHR